MNEALRRRAMEFASEQGKSFTQIVEEAVAKLLSENGQARKPQNHKLPVARGHGLQGGVDFEDTPRFSI